MILVFKKDATEKQIQNAIVKIESLNYQPHLSRGVLKTIIGVTGDDRSISEDEFNQLPGVEKVIHVLKPYKLSSREFHAQNTEIDVNNTIIDNNTFTIIAGPCSVENEEQIESVAALLGKVGLKFIRGGAFKPRSSPYSFQGLGEKGLKILKSGAASYGLGVVTEILSEYHVDMVGKYTDVFQVGARNMQNYALLKALGETQKPVLLKRSPMGTIEELLLSAEYVMKGGNSRVLLCERGIRTFETATRNTLDIGAVPVVKRLSHLPIFVDPSHSMGNWHYVGAASLAALAAGANGLLLEIHPDPSSAKSDGKQSLNFTNFELLLDKLKIVADSLSIRVQ